jgi:peptidoglycan/xylan/chitin deacetylase (PgdA/CDA1 family)
MSYLPKRRQRTAHFFVWNRFASWGKRGTRHAFAGLPMLLLLVTVSLLVAACTLLPNVPSGGSATIPGEPIVVFGGEPQGITEAPAQPQLVTPVAPLSPLESTPSAESAASDTTSAATDAILGAGALPVESEVLATSAPAPALALLLAQPVATSPVAGGIAGAAGVVAPSLRVIETLQPEDHPGEASDSRTVTNATAAPAEPSTVQPGAGVTPDGTLRSLYVPILMYHYLSVPPADANIYRKDLSVAPDLFAQQLDRLLAEGYTTVSLYELAQALQTGASLPEKPVILTFDDGYRDNYQNAFPALRDRGMKATFFVVTDFMDEERPEYMTWEMAREMLAGGMSIESHGRNHASLEGRDDDYLIWQALGSMETIQYELGVRPRFVAYPAGEYDENTERVFASAGYWAGVTTVQGATHASDNPFELTRVRMRGTTTPDELIRLLKVDW